MYTLVHNVLVSKEQCTILGGMLQVSDILFFILHIRLIGYKFWACTQLLLLGGTAFGMLVGTKQHTVLDHINFGSHDQKLLVPVLLIALGITAIGGISSVFGSTGQW
jgi:hypothetical protein